MRPNQLLGGRYRLDKRIGTGGMGEVWRAEDVTLERPVAVKVLHPAMADDADLRQRFLREARAIAALNAPGVVALYDSGEDTEPDGSVLPYLVMEFVVGRPLSAYVPTAESLPPPEVMRLVSQVALGLDAAHRVGIIHRDVKAANILVNRHRDATLLDFGLARRAGETALTTTGSVMGTIEYASPEQLRDEPLTPASDVYSLGVVAYECLAGMRPFDGQTVAAVIAGHLDREPPPLPRTVPPPIERVVMRALAKDPRDRFRTAGDFARACLEAAGAASAPPTPPTRPQVAAPREVRPEPSEPDTVAAEAAPPRRRRTGRVVAVVAGLVLVAALIVAAVVFGPRLSGGAGSDGAEDSASPSPSEEPDYRRPGESVMVSAETGNCLLLRKLDGSETGLAAKMGLCEGSEHEVYEFAPAGGDVVTIEFSGETHGDEIHNCVAAPPDAGKLLADPGCGPEQAWKFAYLRTEDGVDFWRIHTAADDGKCLRAGSKSGDSASVKTCDDSDSQVWRTEAAD